MRSDAPEKTWVLAITIHLRFLRVEEDPYPFTTANRMTLQLSLLYFFNFPIVQYVKYIYL